MRLKNFLIIIAFLLALCGCSSAKTDNNDNDGISEEASAEYSKAIEEALNQCYWRYNYSTVSFVEGKVPSDTVTLDCSEESGYNLRRFQGRSCIIATADLLYFNRETAGTVYFYFVDSMIAGMYYVPIYAASPCSINVRNPYLTPSPFIGFESENEAEEYNTVSVNVSINGMLDTISLEGATYSIFTDGTRLTVNRSNSSSYISSVTEIDLSEEQLVPMSAAFINNSTQMAVLYGTETYSESGGANPVIVPQKIVFFDGNFNKTENEIAADGSDLYSVGYDDGLLLVARSRSIDLYPISNEGPSSRISSCYIGKSIVGMDISDLDGDGQSEYIFTDGMDLFIYRRNSSIFKCLWSTHLSVASFESYIYTGDINKDGIKEIYTISSSGTTSKYVLGENGIYMQNDNIEYGMRLHIADFNADGISDCLVLYGDDTDTPELRITN